MIIDFDKHHTSLSFVSFLWFEIEYLITSIISGPPITTIPNGGNEVEEVRMVDEKVRLNFGNVVNPYNLYCLCNSNNVLFVT